MLPARNTALESYRTTGTKTHRNFNYIDTNFCGSLINQLLKPSLNIAREDFAPLFWSSLFKG